MMGRVVRVGVVASCAVSSMLCVHLVGTAEAFSSPHITALAAIALLLSLPLLDSALAGSSVPPATAGLAAGLPLGFFLRQSAVSVPLAAGAGRVVPASLLISAVMAAVRLARRRSSRQSA